MKKLINLPDGRKLFIIDVENIKDYIYEIVVINGFHCLGSVSYSESYFEGKLSFDIHGAKIVFKDIYSLLGEFGVHFNDPLNFIVYNDGTSNIQRDFWHADSTIIFVRN